MEAFLNDTPGSITVLIDALPHASPSLKSQILPLLATAGKEKSLWPLFRVMMDSSVGEEIRRSAAVHLGLAASLCKDPSVVNAALITNLDHPEPVVRSCCSLALGWEGNGAAVPALMNRLPDPDRDAQAAIIAALSSINDDRVFDYLTRQLKIGNLEEQRSILLNLWRFADRIPEVERSYLEGLDWLPGELIPDILSAVSMIPQTEVILEIYRRLLSEENTDICLQVLENLEALDSLDHQPLNTCLQRLLTNKENRIRRAATRLLAKISSTSP